MIPSACEHYLSLGAITKGLKSWAAKEQSGNAHVGNGLGINPKPYTERNTKIYEYDKATNELFQDKRFLIKTHNVRSAVILKSLLAQDSPLLA